MQASAHGSPSAVRRLEQLPGAGYRRIGRDRQVVAGSCEPEAGLHLRAAAAGLPSAGDGALESLLAGG